MPPPPRRTLHRLLEAAAAFALPQSCALCGAPAAGGAVCATCAAALPRLEGARCGRCGLPLPPGAADPCARCAAGPPAVDSARAAWIYAYPLDRLVLRLKYGGQIALAAWLGAALAPLVPAAADLLVPMPLTAARLRERGFNPSHEIARALGRALGLPVRCAARRTRGGPPQASLPLAARRANVEGAFDCPARLDGLRLAVVDDVMTTGATLDALAGALRAAGAARVDAVVVARALPPAP